MNALSKSLPAIVLLAMMSVKANTQAQPIFAKIDAVNAAAEKKANSYKELLLVRQNAQLRKYPTNKPLPEGEIGLYLKGVGIQPNLEERWVLAQFLYLNGWDLFKNDGRETLFTGKGNENTILSAWIRNNEKLFKAGNITKKDLSVAK